ncbi:hypothetical protein AB0A74_01250 [Saccharothrix sp. NPDC042600]|uniref:hypothetical protein n=1 Tax=Saccharothrix TaxID=2071 RepID=UPI0033E2CACD
MQPTDPPVDRDPESADAERERLLATWEDLAVARLPEDSPAWRTPEVSVVAEAVVAGSPLAEHLFALGYQRSVDGAGPAELRADVEALAEAAGLGGRALRPAEVFEHASRGMDAAVAGTLLEAALVDPSTGFDTPVALLGALWSSARRRCRLGDELWVCRWVAHEGTWRTVELRMIVASTVRALLDGPDLAVFLGDSAIAVIFDDPARQSAVEAAVSGIRNLIVTETVVHEVPGLGSLPKLTGWLLETCPELTATVLRGAQS